MLTVVLTTLLIGGARVWYVRSVDEVYQERAGAERAEILQHVKAIEQLLADRQSTE